MDVAAFRLDAAGELIEQWRCEIVGKNLRMKISADGNRRRYDGKNNFPAADNDEVLQLRPTSDTSKHEVLRMIYDRMASEATTFGAIARQLNTEGIAPPAASEQWTASQVRDICQNPIYIGMSTWNRNTSGTYHSFEDGQRKEKQRGEKNRKHVKADWIFSDEKTFDAIIDPTVFERVQAKVAAIPAQPRRTTRASGYVYSGLMVCANCGGKMTGAKYPAKGATVATRPLSYLCGTYNKWQGERSECPCKAYRVMQTAIDEVMAEYLADVRPVVKSVTRPQIIGTKNVIAYRETATQLAQTQHEMASRVIEWESRHPNAQTTSDDDIAKLYRQIFTSERNTHQAKLDQLETEHSKMSAAYAELPTPRSKEKARPD